MVEIWPALHVGSEVDYEQDVKYRERWVVVHACKDPYHREALGYRTLGAPKGHPGYLVARRGQRLILNLIDAQAPGYVPKELIDAAIRFTWESLKSGLSVLIHCNQGASRAPTVGLSYLLSRTDRLPVRAFEEAEDAFRALYPAYAPAAGMREFARRHFEHYLSWRAE